MSGQERSAAPGRLIVVRFCDPAQSMECMKELGTSESSLFTQLAKPEVRQSVVWTKLRLKTAASNDASAPVFHVEAVQTGKTTSSLSSVEHYASADAAVIVLAAETNLPTEATRLKRGMAIGSAGRAFVAPVSFVGGADDTAAKVAELLPAAKVKVLEVVTPDAAPSPAAADGAASLSLVERAVAAVVARLELQSAKAAASAAPPAPAANAGAPSAFRGLVLHRFDRIKAYVVKVLQGSVGLGDPILSSGNAEASLATVTGLRCYGTLQDIATRATVGTIVTVVVDRYFAASDDFSQSKFDLLESAARGARLSMPAFLIRVRGVSKAVRDLDPAGRVTLAGLGGTSAGYILSHNDETNESLIAVSPFKCAAVVWPGAVLCVKIGYARFQRGEKAEEFATGIVTWHCEALQWHRRILVAWAASAGKPREERLAAVVEVIHTFEADADRGATTRIEKYFFALTALRQLTGSMPTDLARVLIPPEAGIRLRMMCAKGARVSLLAIMTAMASTPADLQTLLEPIARLATAATIEKLDKLPISIETHVSLFPPTTTPLSYQGPAPDLHKASMTWQAGQMTENVWMNLLRGITAYAIMDPATACATVYRVVTVGRIGWAKLTGLNTFPLPTESSSAFAALGLMAGLDPQSDAALIAALFQRFRKVTAWSEFYAHIMQPVSSAPAVAAAAAPAAPGPQAKLTFDGDSHRRWLQAMPFKTSCACTAAWLFLLQNVFLKHRRMRGVSHGVVHLVVTFIVTTAHPILG